MVSCLSLHYFCKGFSSREVSQACPAPFPARGGQSPGSRQGHPPPVMGLIFLRPMCQCLVPPEYAGSRPHAEPTLLQALLPSGALPALVPDTAAPENLQGPTPHIPLSTPCSPRLWLLLQLPLRTTDSTNSCNGVGLRPRLPRGRAFTPRPTPDHHLMLCPGGNMPSPSLPLACTLSRASENCHVRAMQAEPTGDPLCCSYLPGSRRLQTHPEF